MESISAYKSWTKKLVLGLANVIISLAIAIGMAYILIFFNGRLPFPTIYRYTVLIVAIPVARYLILSWEKGFGQLKRADYLNCLIGGLGALLVAIFVYFTLN